MGILSLFGFGRSKDKSENRTSGSSYSFFLGKFNFREAGE